MLIYRYEEHLLMQEEDVNISDELLSGALQKKKGSMDMEDEDVSDLSFDSNDLWVRNDKNFS